MNDSRGKEVVPGDQNWKCWIEELVDSRQSTLQDTRQLLVTQTTMEHIKGDTRSSRLVHSGRNRILTMSENYIYMHNI